jgi:hypothetical protein
MRNGKLFKEIEVYSNTWQNINRGVMVIKWQLNLQHRIHMLKNG